MGSNVAFKPPPRPGSSLRKGRKSSNIGLGAENGTLAPPMPRTNSNVSASSSDAGLGFQSAVDQPEPASSSSRPESPVSSVGTPGDLGYPYEGAPSSEAAQALAATTQCRQRLQILRDENDNQTHAAGLLGAGLLEQRNKIEALMDELAEELQSESAQQDGVFEGQGQGQSDEGASKRDRIRQLQEKLDAEVEEMDRQRVELYKEVLAAGGSSVPIARVSDSPSKSFSALPFLTKDPNFFGTPTRAGNTSIGSNGSAAGPTPKQTDRRARNAAARQSIGDQNLVNQLQDNLVNEIRRLQGLLAERDAEIALLRTAKEDADKDVALWKPKALQLIETEGECKWSFGRSAGRLHLC